MTIIAMRYRNAKKGKARLILPFAFLLLTLLNACTIRTNEIQKVEGKDGTVYRGQLKNGKREGLGVLYKGDSILYSGMWHQGMRQGHGIVRDAEGRLVDGQWDHDTLVTAIRRDSAGVYNGEMNNKFVANGYGHYVDTLDTYYEGQWKDGKRTGFGFSSQHRYFRVGEWKDNTYKGERLNYTSERVYGIDLSKYQHIEGHSFHTIDWDRLRITHLGSLSKKNVSGDINFQVSFIFIKSTEGASMRNPYYAADYAAARSTAIPSAPITISPIAPREPSRHGSSSSTAISRKATCHPCSTWSHCPHK